MYDLICEILKTIRISQNTENRLMVITRDGTESGLEAKMGKGDQIYADEEKLNFWW